MDAIPRLSIQKYDCVGALRVSDHRPVRASYILHLPSQLEAMVYRAFELGGVEPRRHRDHQGTQVCTVS